MQGANIPSFDEIQRYSVNRAGEYEGIRQTLYDFQSYPNAGATQLSFFQVPIGQSGKTDDDTNLELAGQLPAPKHFLVQSIEVYFFPGDASVTVDNNDADDNLTAPNFTNDVQAVQESGFLDFFIGSKTYLREAPIGRFPPKTCLKPEFAAAIQYNEGTASDSTRALSMDYATFGGRPYFVDPWVLITPTQNFNVRLQWASAVSLPSGTDGRIGIVLDGILYRLSQ